MEARASARFIRLTPRKARFVLDAIRGKNVHDALAILKFTPNGAARVVEKLIKSAIANAENNHHMDPDLLEVTTAFADAGPTLKRLQPRAMGRAFRILKRTSHITVAVSEGEEPAKRISRKQVAQVVSKAKPKRGKAEAAKPAKPAKAPKGKAKPAPAESPKEETKPAVTEAQEETKPEPEATEPVAEAQESEGGES